MARSKSSNHWLKEHFDDHYVRLTREKGYRARSAFKLEEIIEKFKLLNGVNSVVDLGAAPGGWCQVIKRQTRPDVRVVGLDLLPIEPVDGVEFILGDFVVDEVYEQLVSLLNGVKIDLVLSDMAPNLSGMNALDQPRSMYLAELALDFCQNCLQLNGAHVVKLFHGEGFEKHLVQMRKYFKKVVVFKPKSSRARSREVFAIATGFK
ncbi:MAG: 23S rRNA methyltransferase [Proteobacteria bacterium]|nr:23S rRNA methyltransferase [Pseudomonadota bacterium]